FFKHAIRQERRHVPKTSIVMIGPDTEVDALIYSLKAAAPEPVIIIEVRETRRTGRARAVALRAVDRKGGFATPQRKLIQPFIILAVCQRRREQQGSILGLRRLRLGKLPLQWPAGGIPEDTRRIVADQRPGRHHNPVADRPDNG